MILKNHSETQNDLNVRPDNLTFEVNLKRSEIKYEDLSGRFNCSMKDFKKQFAHIYSGRLLLMKERVIESCTLKWGSNIPIRKLSELSDENNEKCIVIGTLFKHQDLKPSILKELLEENQVMPQPVRKNYVSDHDQLILEDEVQRIRLIGTFDVNKFVTGVVVGLLGFENTEGKFEVEDMCFAASKSYLERPLAEQNDSYVLMISGLNAGNPENELAMDLLFDLVKGDLGCVPDQEKWAKVCRVIIAGNSVATSHSKSNINTVINTEIEEGVDVLTAVKHLDGILQDLVKSVEVDLMPGEFDPSNHILPQQAIYDCVFPKASQYESFHCVTNPYECLLGGRRILGTSGQPVNNIKALTDIEDPLEVLEKTVLWSHLAPTAPDTLPCYPYYKEDPFIINEQPDVYFTGNQPEFQTKMLNQNGNQTRLICIPSFSETQTSVLLNLRNLECTPVTFTT